MASADDTEQRLALHLAHSPLAIVEWDQDFRVSGWSPKAEQLFGWKASEVIGKLATDFKWVYEPDMTTVARVIEELKSGVKKNNISKNRNYTKSGELVDCEWYNSSLHDEKGRLRSVLSQVLDVTDRMKLRRAEEEKRALNSRIEAILDHTPSPVFVKDLAGNYIYVNRVLASDFNVRLPLPERFRDSDFLPPSVAEILRANDQIVIRENRARTFEEVVIHPDGAAHTYVSVKFPLRDATGAPTAICGIATNVTEIRKSEAERYDLRNQQKWLETVLDRTPTPLVLLDAASKDVIFANEATKRTLGKGLPEGISIKDGIPLFAWKDAAGQPIAECHTPWARAVKGERIRGEEMLLQGPNGKFSLLVFAEALPGMYGHPSIVLLAMQDVSRLKQAELELQRAVEARDEFLSIASHELKTPLTTMKLQVQGLLRRLRKGPAANPTGTEMLEALNQTTKQINRLSALVENLLDVSRITSGKLSLNLEEVDLGELVSEALERDQKQIERAGCRVETSLPHGVIVRADRLRIEQVVDNLLTNALKYGAGKPVAIALAKSGEGWASITVRDQGIGIRKADLGRLFQRFERAVTSRSFGGLGLGLYISKQIVRAHGGEIRAESEKDKGSQFTVALPLLKSAA